MLDVYLLSASIPNGTDRSCDLYGIVAAKTVFKPAEEILMEYLRPWNDEKKYERKQPSH